MGYWDYLGVTGSAKDSDGDLANMATYATATHGLKNNRQSGTRILVTEYLLAI